MIRKLLITTILLLGMTLTAVAPSLPEEDIFRLQVRHITEYLRMEKEEQYRIQFEMFAKALGFRESTNNWQEVNAGGCLGEWQFSPGTLRQLGYKNVTPEKFKEDPTIFPPEEQKKALETLINANVKGIKPYLKHIGTVVNGTKITKAGLVAGMHLGGLGSVIKYLKTGGVSDSTDVNGTSVSDYIREFSQFNI